MIRGQLPIGMNGIRPLLPMQTVTLPGGQTVQIPEINMEEINTNLAASGITPQAPMSMPTTTAPAPIFDTPVSASTMNIEPSEPPSTMPLTPMNTGIDMPFVPSIRQVATGLDPLTEQLLFGIGGEGGFIPGAMRAAEKTFFDEEGRPVVIEERVADFTPDQLRAQELARRGVGIQDRFISGAEGAFGQGIDALRSGFGRAKGLASEGLEATRAGVGQLQRGLGESADLLRGTVGGYDQAMTDRFYNPFEDRVVQQTIDDIMEAGAKRDIAARAGDIGRGGESAFGSRARLGASERQEALGRGLAEALGGIRARGFSEAQQTGLLDKEQQKELRHLDWQV